MASRDLAHAPRYELQYHAPNESFSSFHTSHTSGVPIISIAHLQPSTAYRLRVRATGVSEVCAAGIGLCL